MVALPEFFRSEPVKPRQMTVASLDAKHRVARKALLQTLETMIFPSTPQPDTLQGALMLDAHLERTAALRAEFYQVRQAQGVERTALIESLSRRPRSI